MADVVDRANDAAQRALDASIERARNAAPDRTGAICIECAESIERERLTLFPRTRICDECARARMQERYPL